VAGGVNVCWEKTVVLKAIGMRRRSFFIVMSFNNASYKINRVEL
jgi:hypothetical protein